MNKFAKLSAAVAVGAATLTAGAGTASATTMWPCGDHWCTKAVNKTGVHRYYVGSGTIEYYVNAGETVVLVCYAGTDYHGGRPSWKSGWVRGFDLDTGHDPNPNVPPCGG